MKVIGKVADCFTPLTALTAQALKHAGCDGVARYLGKLTHNWPKGITPEEVKIIFAAGLKLILIWEGLPTRAAYFTFAQGLRDATDTLKELEWLGLPHGGTVYWTVDYPAVPKDFAAIQTYFKAIERVVANVVDGGAYGDYDVLTDLHAHAPVAMYWQTAGMSEGKIAPFICMYQNKFNVAVGSLRIDSNDVYQNPGWWSGMSNPTLQLGSMGANVKTLQNDLNTVGANPKLAVDGDFGPLTLAAVKAFQRTHGLAQDGIVGPLTWGALTKALEPKPAPPAQNYTMVVTEASTALANTFSMIDIQTLADGKPLASQPITITVNGQQVCSDKTGIDGLYQWGITETTAKADTVIVSWTDPAGKVHTTTHTTQFTVPHSSPTPVPADDKVVVSFPMLPTSDANNAVYFNMTAPNGQLIQCQLDTGAFELMFTSSAAAILGLQNEGNETIGGVGGQTQAYKSHATFTINGVTFTGVPCTVDNSFPGYPLFGYRFFVDNGYDLLVSQKHQTVTIMRAI